MRQAEAEVGSRKADVAARRGSISIMRPSARRSTAHRPALVSEGALAVQNETTNLATIQQLDPIYADFTQSVAEMNALQALLKSGELDRIGPDAARAVWCSTTATIYPAREICCFRTSRSMPDTGQVTLRGQFPNPRRELLPGMYVRVQIEQGSSRRHRRAAAGDPAQRRRRQRGLRGQRRWPRRDSARRHRRDAGRSVAGRRRS